MKRKLVSDWKTHNLIKFINLLFLCLILVSCDDIIKLLDNLDNNKHKTIEVNESPKEKCVEAKIDSVWTERRSEFVWTPYQHVSQFTIVHCKFRVDNYNGRTGSVVALVEPQYSLGENKRSYYAYEPYTPSYDSSLWNDFTIKIEDWAILKYGDNERNYKVKVLISDDSNNTLAVSNYVGIQLD